MPKLLQRAVIVLFCSVALMTSAAADAQQKRSVVMIVIDSLRSDHLQTYGYSRRTSPNILAFSKSATTFLNAYPAASWTRPSILSLLTGEYSSELTSNISGSAPLTNEHRTLATVLRSNGYRTGAFYNTAQMTPKLANLQGGFDDFVDYGVQGANAALEPRVAEGVDRTISFLRQTQRPALAVLHTLDPHHPYVPKQNAFGTTAPAKYKNSYALASGIPDYDPTEVKPCFLLKDPAVVPALLDLYDSEILELDHELGRLIAFIEATPRYRDAIVVVTADHGEEFGEHGGLFHGARFYEESLRVPLIIRDRLRPYGAGRRVDSIVSLVDVLPTVLQALGLITNDSGFSGRSLVPYFTRRGGPVRDVAFIEKPGCLHDAMVAVRNGRWKMILRLTRPKVELYDLVSDPSEKNDLSQSKTPATLRAYAELYASFKEWYRRVNRPLSTRAGDGTPEIPPELRKRLEALGYLH